MQSKQLESNKTENFYCIPFLYEDNNEQKKNGTAVFPVIFPFFLHLKFYYCSHAFLYFLFSNPSSKHFVVTVDFYSIISSVIIFLLLLLLNVCCIRYKISNETCKLRRVQRKTAIRQQNRTWLGFYYTNNNA